MLTIITPAGAAVFQSEDGALAGRTSPMDREHDRIFGRRHLDTASAIPSTRLQLKNRRSFERSWLLQAGFTPAAAWRHSQYPVEHHRRRLISGSTSTDSLR